MKRSSLLCGWQMKSDDKDGYDDDGDARTHHVLRQNDLLKHMQTTRATRLCSNTTKTARKLNKRKLNKQFISVSSRLERNDRITSHIISVLLLLLCSNGTEHTSSSVIAECATIGRRLFSNAKTTTRRTSCRGRTYPQKLHTIVASIDQFNEMIKLCEYYILFSVPPPSLHRLLLLLRVGMTPHNKRSTATENVPQWHMCRMTFVVTRNKHLAVVERVLDWPRDKIRFLLCEKLSWSIDIDTMNCERASEWAKKKKKKSNKMKMIRHERAGEEDDDGDDDNCMQ